ncbi:hypothetical protein EPI10_021015 [Gossypium australe]|uniref:Uncharacterized protein n=1 Tax=Gossypium australe TaxID=47621 RepID=A0A5B6WHN8_9ROSI|nr:hypothetical protein EPI10_021015 [Gossypium australe]
MERIRRRSGFVNGIDVEAEGSRGGLCLAWREDCKKVIFKESGDSQAFTGRLMLMTNMYRRAC